MGVATTAAPYGFWATNPTKELAHWVYLLGQPLSRNLVFQNFSGEPPPPPPLKTFNYMPEIIGCLIMDLKLALSYMNVWYLSANQEFPTNS